MIGQGAGGSLVWSIAWRFLRGSRSRLLEGTARAALLATALGVTAMVVAMALMTGYREDLQTKLIRGNAAVIAYPVGAVAGALHSAEGSQGLLDTRLARLQAIPGVLRVGRVAYGQGSLASARFPQGIDVVLRGVDPGGGQLTATAEQLTARPEGAAGGPPGAAGTPVAPAAAGLPGAPASMKPSSVPPGGAAGGEAPIPGMVLGSDLAARLGVHPGEVLRLVVMGFESGRPRFRFQSVRLTATFTTGFAEFDRSWALLERSRVERLMGIQAAADLLELTVADPGQAPRTALEASRVLDPDYVVTDWQQLNHELFSALKLQQVALFVVLGLIVLVSTFNVASTLVVLVRERMRDIGVLGAMGLAPARLRGVFLTYGAILGWVGTLLGLAAGWAISWTLTTFHLIRFDSEVAAIYFISSVPFRVAAGDLLAVAGFALLVTLLACFVPAWRAARLDPSSALRYE